MARDPVHVGRLKPAEWLGRPVHVVVDRPLGSLHPNGTFSYEQNYGFVPGYVAADGDELDAYIIGVDEPVHAFDGHVVAVVLRDDDVEDKLVVSGGAPWSAKDVADAIRFQEQFFESRIVVADDTAPGL